ncbi:OmpA family protein [Cesiribacter andamanensis]|uniref:Root adhesin n=1 Tax=Cesiribacter andamanensis AMV16 TaxID=1279009 RepID=M7NA37_9BACT|nr:OmpA family protein [Cesiribacter andamanensis]EMR04127.1 Root adhesin [Cesiribacter andamanensis AMV16]
MRTGLVLLMACAGLSGAFAQTKQQKEEAEEPKFELISLSRDVNTQYHDSAPVVAPDGKTLYFTVNDHPQNTHGKGSQDIWYSEIDATGQWGKAKHMPAPLNTNQFNQVLSVSPDGNTLLVRGGSGKNSLGFSLCRRVNGQWQKPEALKIEGFDKMAKGRFNGAFLALDASALILYFNEVEGAKYSDLYVSFPKGNSWSRPAPITTLNTRLDEFGPYLAPDNKTMYFASNRPGGFGNADIYKTVRQDDSWQKWSKPENIGAPINTGGFDAYYAIGNADSLVFTTRAYMSADGGHLDIHTLRRIKEKKAKIMLAGRVVDQKSGELVPHASIRILQGGEAIGVTETQLGQPDFETQLPGPGEFQLLVSAEGYLAGADTFAVEPTKIDMSVYRTIYVKKLEVGLSVRLNNIFFDFDKTTLREESFPELDKVVELMEQNPNLYIEIGGHTDDKGSDEYNERLSQGRAEAVREYITAKWIEPARVTARGYGESKPEVPNDTDDNRQINRRVEFTILQNTARK